MGQTQNAPITDASGGFGALIARTLLRWGHTWFAAMRDATGRNAGFAAALEEFAATPAGSLHVLELDVSQKGSVKMAVDKALEGLADAVLRIIEARAGERPLRLVVDPMTGGDAPGLLNRASSKIQSELLDGLGIDESSPVRGS